VKKKVGAGEGTDEMKKSHTSSAKDEKPYGRNRGKDARRRWKGKKNLKIEGGGGGTKLALKKGGRLFHKKSEKSPAKKREK